MEDQSFAQQNHVQQYNWRVQLSTIGISPELWKEMDELARRWATDPCGQLSAEIPRINIGYPRDNVLAGLGLKFQYHIHHQDKWSALSVLNDIEVRGALLLSDLRSRREACNNGE